MFVFVISASGLSSGAVFSTESFSNIFEGVWGQAFFKKFPPIKLNHKSGGQKYVFDQN